MPFVPRRRKVPTSGYGRRVMAKYRKRFPVRRRMGLARSLVNPMPTFTETVLEPRNGGIILGNAGGNFAVAISALPQLAQYSNLYRQYRINWVKVMVFPETASTVTDGNTLFQNNAAAIAVTGQARIAFAINDTPGLPAPANEGDVLLDNGCRVKSLGAKFAVSFKPVVDQQIVSGGAASVSQREKYKPWLSFAAPGQIDPTHYGVSYWISHYMPNPAPQQWKVYYKINFTLRDAK